MTYRGKRAFDLLLVTVAAPLWVPLLAGLAAAVRLSLGTPVLFRQTRAGFHGAPFDLLKFRTMDDSRDDAGRLLPDHLRLGRFGAWLRRTSLDELPGLWNVLRGELSLVGPRPLLPAYLPLYSLRHARRHEVPPGITGLAQVSGRNALSWPEKLDLDVAYVERNSLRADLHILARTAAAVLTGRGVTTAEGVSMPYFTGYEDPAADSTSISAATTRD